MFDICSRVLAVTPQSIDVMISTYLWEGPFREHNDQRCLRDTINDICAIRIAICPDKPSLHNHLRRRVFGESKPSRPLFLNRSQQRTGECEIACSTRSDSVARKGPIAFHVLHFLSSERFRYVLRFAWSYICFKVQIHRRHLLTIFSKLHARKILHFGLTRSDEGRGNAN